MCAVLKIDVSGRPLTWISKREAANLICNNKVRYSFGETKLTLIGGYNKLGTRSRMFVDPIIAVDHNKNFKESLPLTLFYLYQRDKSCLYCGVELPWWKYTKDHIIPRSRQGETAWRNLALSCRHCNNNVKGDKLLHETNLQLRAVPFTPSKSEHLFWQYSNCDSDQFSFLSKGFKHVSKKAA
ncbi:hypothetical protein A3715_10625 [Oleiphilus sp. HI0009]|nr:hypothetical protein A3715_10625 [Oleiphilus sp. HI0009]